MLCGKNESVVYMTDVLWEWPVRLRVALVLSSDWRYLTSSVCVCGCVRD